MWVMVESKLTNTASLKITAYDETNGTKTAQVFMTKVENVDLLVGLLWLIFLVDLTFSMISLVFRSSIMVPRKIFKYLEL